MSLAPVGFERNRKVALGLAISIVLITTVRADESLQSATLFFSPSERIDIDRSGNLLKSETVIAAIETEALGEVDELLEEGCRQQRICRVDI